MAAAKLPVRRRFTGTAEGDDMQRLAQQTAERANACPFFVGVLVSGVVFAAGVDRLVDHGLGARPQGCLVLRSYGANVCTGVGESATQPTNTDAQLRMVSPVACTVDLWIF